MSGSLTATQTTITQYYENILQRAPLPAGLEGWSAAVDSGVLTLLQVEQAIIASPEAQAGVVPVIELFTALQRTPFSPGLAKWTHALQAPGASLASAAEALLASAEGKGIYGTGAGPGAGDANSAFVNTVFETVLGRAPLTAGAASWAGLLTSGAATPAEVLADIVGSAEAQARDAAAVTKFLVAAGEGTADYGTPLDLGGSIGATFTLTPGLDTITPDTNSTGSALPGTGDDTFNATESNTAFGVIPTWTAGDAVTGGGGDDTFNVNQTRAINTPVGATVMNIQTVNLASGAGVGTTAPLDTTGWTGLTALNIQEASTTFASAVTAAATTDVNLNDLSQTTGTISVQGGNDIDITSTGETGGGATITVGSTTMPAAGTVTVTDSSDPTDGNTTLGHISVTGGTAVVVTQNELGALGGTILGGMVNVTGTATTTDVTILQSARIPSSATVTGVIDGDVGINDANGNSSTKTGTIATASLANFGAATIIDNALANLHLTGTGGGVTVTDNLTTPTATTLALSLSGLTNTGGFTDNTVKTLNIKTFDTTPSNLGGLTDNALTTLTVSGSEALILGALTAPLLTAITVSGRAGLTAALGPNTSFTSTGHGTDVVSIVGPTTQTVTGNGSADEEIVWNSASAPAAATAPAPAYLGTVTGFSVLGIGSAVTAGETFDMSKIAGFSSFDVEGNTVVGLGTISLSKVDSGSPLSIDGTFTGTLSYKTSDTAGADDSLALTLGTAATTAGFVVGGLIAEDSTSTGIGTLSVTSNASTVGASNTISSLTDPALSALSVDGSGGLTITGPLTTSATSLTIDGSQQTGTAGINTGMVTAALTSLTAGGTNAIALAGLTDTAAAVTVTNDGSSTLAIGTLSDGALTSLTLDGKVSATVGTSVTTGVTIDGTTDDSPVHVTHTGLTAAGNTDSITLGDGANSVSDTTALAGSTVDITVGMGTNAITLGALAANNVAFADHSATTVDNVSVAATTTGSLVPTATIMGLNATGVDTITFAGDPSANTGSITTYTTAALNSLGAALGTGDPTNLQGIIADLFHGAPGGALAQHAIGEFQFDNNTYFVEQANATGTAFGTGDTLVKLTGLQNFSSASNVTAGGILHLVG